ncbi:hypothetical protein AAFC00_003337 [Neodothiora populina]|uniref:Fe2OG dioxygenase domain-containing protein n=1 Tax=Neodothiora populina TaxID=2781224 RepID=A0ABR3PA72_9PEZI
MIAKNEQESSSIPVVDFSEWQDDAPAEVRGKIASDLIKACREVGFVYIINHGVGKALLDEAFAMSKKLFDLSHEQKMLAPHPPNPEWHRGYSSPGLEKVSQVYGMDADPQTVGEQLREVKDCKESYEVGSEGNKEQPPIWLPEDVLPGFRDFETSFYWKCNEVARKLLAAMAIGLGLNDANFILKYHSGHNNQLRLLHYPPVPAIELESNKSARMPAHTDWGSITMLFQDKCGGLQVEDPHKRGRFIDATPMQGALIMNVGDLLMRWSNDQLKSTMHRVTLPPLSDRFEGEQRLTRARYSIPYFVSPDENSVVECLPACTSAAEPVKYEATNWGEYRRMRAALQYRRSDEAAPSAITI